MCSLLQSRLFGMFQRLSIHPSREGASAAPRGQLSHDRCQGQPYRSHNDGGNHTFPKKINDRTHNYKLRPHRTAAAQGKKGPRPKKPQRPSKPPAPAPLGRTSVSLEGQTPRHETPRPARGYDTPSMCLHLARGPWPHGRVPDPLEGPSPSRKPPPRSRSPSARGAAPAPPTRALKALTHRGRSGQRRTTATPVF
jgi:hypothetical protein